MGPNLEATADDGGWRCECGARFGTAKELGIHGQSSHGRLHNVYLCGRRRTFRSSNARSLPCDRRYCKPSKEEPSSPSSLQFPCQLCTSRFNNKSGRSQHMRVKHPLEYNDQLETKADVNKIWSERELQDLARLQIRLGPCTKINIELQKQFEHRTVQAIAAVRKKDTFRNLVNELRSEMETSTSPVPEAAACVSPRDEEEVASPSNSIRDSIASFCTSNTPCPDTLDGAFAGYLLAFETVGVDLAFQNLVANLVRLFPQRKPKTRVGKNKSRPQMKRCRSKKPRDVRRRKEYWAAQQYLKSNFSTLGLTLFQKAGPLPSFVAMSRTPLRCSIFIARSSARLCTPSHKIGTFLPFSPRYLSPSRRRKSRSPSAT